MDKCFVVSKKDAITIMHKAIEKMETVDDNSVFILTIDLDGNGISDSGKHVTVKNGEKIIEESKSRIFSGNRYMSQLDLYSVKQPDIKNIRKKGIMKTILLPGIWYNSVPKIPIDKNVCSSYYIPINL